MTKYLPSLIAAAVALMTVFADPLQAFVAAHPAVAAVVAAVGTIIAHLMPSPRQQG